MAIVSGTKVVDDGLVFHYDMENLNSYKGPPCENLVPSGMRTCSANFTTQAWHVEQFFYETTTDKGRTDVKRIWCNPTKTGSQPYADFGFQASRPGGTQIGDVYQVSFDSTGEIGITVYANGYKIPDATDVGTVNNTTNTSLGNGWYRKSFNVTVTAAGNTHWRFGFNSNNYYVEKLVDNFQIIYAGVDSSFVDGTRSNTEAIIDLTGNQTITANSLTYNNDNTFEFNGIDDYLSFNVPATYGNFTVELWVKMDTVSGQQRWYSNDSTGTFTLYYNGGWAFHYNPLAGTPPSTSTSPVRGAVAGVWDHVVVTNDQSNSTTGAKCYVNGDFVGSGIPAVSLIAAGNKIGTREGATNWCDGQCAITRVYDRVLSATEIAQNFNASRTRFGI